MAAVEAESAALREVELRVRAIPGRYDLEHLQAFHRYLFGDVYVWAGEPRTTHLAKYEYETGGRLSRFTPPNQIVAEGGRVFRRLGGTRAFTGVLRNVVVQRLTTSYAAVNLLHPFREGNGRSTRAFYSQLMRDAGLHLSFESLSHERWIRASIDANFGAPEALRRALAQATDPAALERFREVAPVLEAMRRDGVFDWNEHYLAVTPAARRIEGRVAIANERAFVAVAEGRLEIGSSVALGHIPSVGQDVVYVEPRLRERGIELAPEP